MTIAAAYRIGTVPALLSDVLVTGGPSKAHQPIATRVDLEGPLPIEWMVPVNGLIRKSMVVCPNVAVSAAGNGLGAWAVLTWLRDQLIGKAPSASELAQILSDCSEAPSKTVECHLVGWVIDGGTPRSFSWVSYEADNVHWDSDYITGTGASMLKALAWSEHQRSWAIETFDHAQHYGLQQIASLFLNEMTNGITIQSLFGGGYDLILWDGTKFRLASDVTFLFMSRDWMTSKEKPIAGHAPILIRQMEIEDSLVVRAVLSENSIGIATDKHERTAVIAPVTSLGQTHRFDQPHNLTEVPFFSDRVFVAVSGRGADGYNQHWSGGVMNDPATPFSLKQVPNSNKVRFFLPTGAMNFVRDAAERQFNRPTSFTDQTASDPL